MKPMNFCSYFNIPENSMYDVISACEERREWLFACTARLPHCAVSDVLHTQIDMDETSGISQETLGISFYRCLSDREGMIRMINYGGRRIHAQQILSAAKRLMPNIPKKAWSVQRTHIYLESDEDVMMFMLAYGANHVTTA